MIGNLIFDSRTVIFYLSIEMNPKSTFRIVLIHCLLGILNCLDWRCTEDFCLDYEVTYKCPTMDVAVCYNESLALMIPSTTVCNCCDFCIEYQDIDEPCIIGGPGQLLPNQMCGPGLQCINNSCKKMTEPEYDELDTSSSYRCDNGKCRCGIQTSDGWEEIFGEFDESSIEDHPQCGCSKLAYKARNQALRFLPFSGVYQPFARCLQNGQFDPLQCANGGCSCIDQFTGEYDQTIPMVPTISLGPQTPVCYNTALGHKPTYYNDCELAVMKIQREKDLAEADGITYMFAEKIVCRPDGTFEQIPVNSYLYLY